MQWDPRELFYLHDWNVIDVADGFDWQQIVAAQRHALTLTGGQPTAIVYRTVKGWRYGVQGRASHGAGHKLCSDGYYEALAELMTASAAGLTLPICDLGAPRCRRGEDGAAEREACFWEALEVLRSLLERREPCPPPWRRACARRASVWMLALARRARARRAWRPSTRRPQQLGTAVPDELRLAPGHGHDAACRAGPRPALRRRRLGRRRADGLGRSAGLDQREPGAARALPPASGTP